MLILRVPSTLLPDQPPTSSLDDLVPVSLKPGPQERRFRARVAAGASRLGPAIGRPPYAEGELRCWRLNDAIDMAYDIKPTIGQEKCFFLER